MSLEIVADPGPYFPGDTVSGTVRVTPGYSFRSLRAELVYRERTKDYADAGRVADVAPLEEGEAPRFELVLPLDALPNVAGDRGRLTWEVAVRADRRGLDDHAQMDLDVRLPAPDS
jgi:hypothetical protein